ncbi:GNAT family N-acetyltransferase [Dietzia timorensis]|uniref:N-acetyltransferase domain-containing protein n=1 Tax=Dietzia timorensis TaxID=499555 RepID=A0A173LNJ2_9ACTN|nr:GNAT family N-acetyltransferase [Dietzia timorensis]ANI92130.1 Hypothetical protein BJL86_1348 [Dietzia timorensis]
MNCFSAQIRTIADDEFEVLESIENDADRVLIDILQPTRWNPAPPGNTRRGHAGTVLVAEEPIESRSPIAGFIDVRYVDSVTAYVDVLAVRRQSMRRGIGRSLLQEATARAMYSGMEHLTLRTYRSIAFNAPFYASEGFSPFSPAENATWAAKVLAAERAGGLPVPEDRVFMHLPLRSPRYGGPT